VNVDPDLGVGDGDRTAHVVERDDASLGIGRPPDGVVEAGVAFVGDRLRVGVVRAQAGSLEFREVWWSSWSTGFTEPLGSYNAG
jgi:hypothetical protein